MIAPSTNIYLCHGVPIDKNYNHTLYFTDNVQQLNTFMSYVKFAQVDYTYQRQNIGVVKVNLAYDVLTDINYMFFQNTAYANKWFYAFVDSIEYVNDVTTKVYFTIDEMQTWYFDYTMPACYVEREHTLTDEIGEHVVPESFDCEEYSDIYEDYVDFNKMYACIVSTVPLDDICLGMDSQIPQGYAWYRLKPIEQFGTTAGKLYGYGTGVYIYPGIIPTNTQLSDYDTTNYYLQELYPYSYSTGYQYHPLTLEDILARINLGWVSTSYNLQTHPLALDAIINIYLYPALFSFKQNFDRNPTLNKGASSSANINITVPQHFCYRNLIKPNYVAKNNKMYNYPYKKITISNRCNSEVSYKVENSGLGNQMAFVWQGVMGINAKCLMVPVLYNRELDNTEYGVELSDLPNYIYTSSKYAEFWERNTYRFGMSLLTTVLSTELSVRQNGLIMTKGSKSNAKEIINPQEVNGAFDIVENITSLGDIKNSPPTSYGNINADYFWQAYKKYGFKIMVKAIWGEQAEIIDNYFSMYGYAIKNVKLPNIKNSNNLRPHWNYIKTIASIILPISGKGMPQDSINRISNIYDNGITFWNNPTEVGNYSLDNSPLITMKGESVNEN